MANFYANTVAEFRAAVAIQTIKLCRDTEKKNY